VHRRTLIASLAALALPAGQRTALADAEPPNAPWQKPAFPDQTRAPGPASPTGIEIGVFTETLPRSWAFAFLPDGRVITTQKAGEIRLISPDGKRVSAVEGAPKVDSRGQGGLLDVAVSPGFASDRLVYMSFAEPRGSYGNGTSVARARLVEDDGGAKLADLQVIFRQEPAWNNNLHFGSRLVFARDGRLFVTVGERSDAATRGQAQDLRSGLGKIFRIEADGSVPRDNPFVGRDGALGAIWSYGHRNLQSAALDGEGRLWTVEHGPRGGDELNRPEAGKNYGWPLVTYGVEYSGNRVGEGVTQKAGTEQPVYYWDPVIAPSGMAIYRGDRFPAWRGAILIGGLVSQGLVVLRMKDDRVASEERISLGARIRDVREGPDGAVYVLTEGEAAGSRILRLTPKE
jgi:glucose/arabinose dehydrogenase